MQRKEPLCPDNCLEGADGCHVWFAGTQYANEACMFYAYNMSVRITVVIILHQFCVFHAVNILHYLGLQITAVRFDIHNLPLFVLP